jgi:protein-glucosylgalactosylhydroxylysine glucosidase
MLVAAGGLPEPVAVQQRLLGNSSQEHLAASFTLPRPSPQIRTRVIDRTVLVRRHNPVLRNCDPLSPLSVGNGEFAFTADITGLQTLPQEYEKAMPLCTMSQWGWHTRPVPAGLDPKGLRLTHYDTHGREVGYQTSSEGQTELYTWLRENPHRLHLGQIGFCRGGSRNSEIEVGDFSEIKQELDLWRGVLTSSFRFEGETVIVRTAVHPRLDLLAVSIKSRLIDEGRLAIRIGFPYGSPSMQAADWNQPAKHETEIVSNNNGRADLRRTLDGDKYFVAIVWESAGKLVPVDSHSLILSGSNRSRGQLGFVAVFSPNLVATSLPSVQATFAASANHWNSFWNAGGVVELARSKDPRAPELERRVVLSQYLTAIQCAGSRPPQETGLTVNSWYGKFHLEMHWWHAAHFPLWNRLPLLEKSLGWYDAILPSAKALAKSQGYQGARWPKMVGPEGRDSPSPIGPLLIWQQPHPIFYAELCYRSHPNRQTLDRYRAIVFESATFMASYAFWEESRSRYVLGPPLIPAQENHPPRESWNPTFELAYWRYGLKTAQSWRERLGLRRDPTWDKVIKGLSSLPVKDGVYLAHENCPQTYTERNHDHPSMLGAYGVLSGEGVDRETMRRTLHKTIKEWRWDQTWGWDYPLTAMTAARLGESKIAVDALLMATEKNRYLPNGHNWQRQNLPCYLPGNGGLLYAVAIMAAGWQGAPQTHAPGFPQDGSWVVGFENLNSAVARTV